MKSTDWPMPSPGHRAPQSVACPLRSTLDGYEVEELTGRDLGRILSEIALREGPESDCRSVDTGLG